MVPRNGHDGSESIVISRVRGVRFGGLDFLFFDHSSRHTFDNRCDFVSLISEFLLA
jgi:hypothetical protein